MHISDIIHNQSLLVNQEKQNRNICEPTVSAEIQHLIKHYKLLDEYVTRFQLLEQCKFKNYYSKYLDEFVCIDSTQQTNTFLGNILTFDGKIIQWAPHSYK